MMLKHLLPFSFMITILDGKKVHNYMYISIIYIFFGCTSYGYSWSPTKMCVVLVVVKLCLLEQLAKFNDSLSEAFFTSMEKAI